MATRISAAEVLLGQTENDPLRRMADLIVREATKAGADAVELAIQDSSASGVASSVRMKVDGEWRELTEPPPVNMIVGLFAVFAAAGSAHFDSDGMTGTLTLLGDGEVRCARLRGEWRPGGAAMIISFA